MGHPNILSHRRWCPVIYRRLAESIKCMDESEQPKAREYQNVRHWMPVQVIDILIANRDFETAARIESAHEMFFLSFSFRIAEQLALVRTGQFPSQIDFEELLDAARSEVAFHRNWEEHCIASFSQEDDWNLTTRPLRSAFQTTSKAREKLSQEISTGSDNWLDAHNHVNKKTT